MAIYLPVAVFCALLAPLAAFRTQADPPDEASVRVLSEHSELVPGGGTWIALEWTLPKDWHIYWQNPGESGLPTEVAVSAGKGLQVGALQWPIPKRFSDGLATSYGYEHSALLWMRVDVDPEFVGERAELSLSASWLLCHADLGCFPGEKRLSLGLPVRREAGGEPLALSPDAARIQAAREAGPREAPGVLASVGAGSGGHILTVRFPEPEPVGSDSETPAVEHWDTERLRNCGVEFFPLEGGRVESGAAQVARWQGRTLELALRSPTQSQGAPTRGLLVLRPRGEAPAVALLISAEDQTQG